MFCGDDGVDRAPDVWVPAPRLRGDMVRGNDGMRREPFDKLRVNGVVSPYMRGESLDFARDRLCRTMHGHTLSHHVCQRIS